MWNDPKTKYMFAFEKAVFELLGRGYGAIHGSLKEGLWCNAHMWYGIGLDSDLAAVRFVTDVIVPYHTHLIADRDLAMFLHGAYHAEATEYC